MPVRFLPRFLLILAAVAGASACQHTAETRVADYDTYQIIDVGSAHYTTPQGVRAAKTGPYFVVHEVEYLPRTTVRVEVDPSPPRDFRFDADAEKRKFLDELRDGYMRSAQYSERDAQRRIKVLAEARGEDGKPLHAVLFVIRQHKDTATLRLVGPKENREEINRLAERLADAMELRRYSPAEEAGVKAAMLEEKS